MDRTKIDKVMADIQYGWVDRGGGRHERLIGFSENYALQLPDELLKSKLGVCWDQVELERRLFSEQKVTTHAYFIVFYGKKNCPSHTFLLAEDGDKIIWYEHSWEKWKGWYEFDSIEDALRDVREKFIELEIHDTFDADMLCIYEYSAPSEKLGCLDFYHFCEAGKSVNENL